MQYSKKKFILCLLVMFSFSLFTVYQFHLFRVIDINKFGRVLGISAFSLISLSSLCALFRVALFRYFRFILLSAGLLANVIIKLINIPYFFTQMSRINVLCSAILILSIAGLLISVVFFMVAGHRIVPYRNRMVLMVLMTLTFLLNAAFDSLLIVTIENFITVLNFIIYVFSQSAMIILLVYFASIRHKREVGREVQLTFIMMPLVIILYIFCLIIELLLMIKYHQNIDLNFTHTLISRGFYYFGFIGTAITFMLDMPKPDMESRK